MDEFFKKEEKTNALYTADKEMKIAESKIDRSKVKEEIQKRIKQVGGDRTALEKKMHEFEKECVEKGWNRDQSWDKTLYKKLKNQNPIDQRAYEQLEYKEKLNHEKMQKIIKDVETEFESKGYKDYKKILQEEGNKMVHDTPKYDLGRYREKMRLKELELQRQRLQPQGKPITRMKVNHAIMKQLIDEVDTDLNRERTDYLRQHDTQAKTNQKKGQKFQFKQQQQAGMDNEMMDPAQVQQQQAQQAREEAKLLRKGKLGSKNALIERKVGVEREWAETKLELEELQQVIEGQSKDANKFKNHPELKLKFADPKVAAEINRENQEQFKNAQKKMKELNIEKKVESKFDIIEKVQKDLKDTLKEEQKHFKMYGQEKVPKIRIKHDQPLGKVLGDMTKGQKEGIVELLRPTEEEAAKYFAKHGKSIDEVVNIYQANPSGGLPNQQPQGKVFLENPEAFLEDIQTKINKAKEEIKVLKDPKYQNYKFPDDLTKKAPKAEIPQAKVLSKEMQETLHLEQVKVKQLEEIKRLEKGSITTQEWRKAMGADISKEPFEKFIKEEGPNSWELYVKKKDKSAFELWEVDPLNENKIIDKNYIDYSKPENAQKAKQLEAEVVAYTQKLETNLLEEQIIQAKQQKEAILKLQEKTVMKEVLKKELGVKSFDVAHLRPAAKNEEQFLKSQGEYYASKVPKEGNAMFKEGYKADSLDRWLARNNGKWDLEKYSKEVEKAMHDQMDHQHHGGKIKLEYGPSRVFTEKELHDLVDGLEGKTYPSGVKQSEAYLSEIKGLPKITEGPPIENVKHDFWDLEEMNLKNEKNLKSGVNTVETKAAQALGKETVKDFANVGIENAVTMKGWNLTSEQMQGWTVNGKPVDIPAIKRQKELVANAKKLREIERTLGKESKDSFRGFQQAKSSQLQAGDGSTKVQGKVLNKEKEVKSATKDTKKVAKETPKAKKDIKKTATATKAKTTSVKKVTPKVAPKVATKVKVDNKKVTTKTKAKVSEKVKTTDVKVKVAKKVKGPEVVVQKMKDGKVVSDVKVTKDVKVVSDVKVTKDVKVVKEVKDVKVKATVPKVATTVKVKEATVITQEVKGAKVVSQEVKTASVAQKVHDPLFVKAPKGEVSKVAPKVEAPLPKLSESEISKLKTKNLKVAEQVHDPLFASKAPVPEVKPVVLEKEIVKNTLPTKSNVFRAEDFSQRKPFKGLWRGTTTKTEGQRLGNVQGGSRTGQGAGQRLFQTDQNYEKSKVEQESKTKIQKAKDEFYNEKRQERYSKEMSEGKRGPRRHYEGVQQNKWPPFDSTKDGHYGEWRQRMYLKHLSPDAQKKRTNRNDYFENLREQRAKQRVIQLEKFKAEQQVLNSDQRKAFEERQTKKLRADAKTQEIQQAQRRSRIVARAEREMKVQKESPFAVLKKKQPIMQKPKSNLVEEAIREVAKMTKEDSSILGLMKTSRIHCLPVKVLPDQVLFNELHQIQKVPQQFVEQPLLSKLNKASIQRLFGINSFSPENHGKNLKFFIDKGEFLEKRYKEILTELEARGLKGALNNRLFKFDVTRFKEADLYQSWEADSYCIAQNQKYITKWAEKEPAMFKITAHGDKLTEEEMKEFTKKQNKIRDTIDKESKIVMQRQRDGKRQIKRSQRDLGRWNPKMKTDVIPAPKVQATLATDIIPAAPKIIGKDLSALSSLKTDTQAQSILADIVQVSEQSPTDAAKTAKTVVKEAKGKAKTFVEKGKTAVKEAVEKGKKAAKEVVEKGKTVAKETVEKGTAAAKDTGKKMLNKLKDLAKTEVAQEAGKAAGKGANTLLVFSPLLFLAWDYYNSGSMVHSVITCARDFFWPAAVVVAKSVNASPYQMLATNVVGIGWTIYNCFFAEHEEPQESTSVESQDFTNPETLKSDLTARVSLRQRWRNRRIEKQMSCKNRKQKSGFFARFTNKIQNKKAFFARRKLNKHKSTIARKQKIALRRVARNNKRTWFQIKTLAWKDKRQTRLSKNLI